MNPHKRTTLNEAWGPGWINAGIFSVLTAGGWSPPWAGDVPTTPPLNAQYHGNYSGSKLTSPLVDGLLVDGLLPDSAKAELADVIRSMFSMNWGKLWETLKFEYNPIENYDMTETGEDVTTGTDKGETSRSTTYGRQEAHDFRDETTDTGTVDISKTSEGDTDRKTTGNIDRKHGETITTIRQGTQEREHGVYGFNTVEEAAPASHDTDTENITNTDTHGGTDTDTSTGTETNHQTGTETDKETRSLSVDKDTTGTIKHTGTDTEEGTTSEEKNSTLEHTLTRRGNIGVTTSQQMIEQERALWVWKFFDQVFKDIDTVLTSPIY